MLTEKYEVSSTCVCERKKKQYYRSVCRDLVLSGFVLETRTKTTATLSTYHEDFKHRV